MALTAAQIVTQACQIANTPGYTSQAGNLLNLILQELCQNYDFDAAKATFSLAFNTSLATTSTYPNIASGGGPYPLPSTFLRMADNKDAIWYLNGVPYPMIPCDLSEYDNLVQQAGMQAYPYIFATDMSQSPPNLLVWPPPAGNYTGIIRYFKQMPDISSPESSASAPWFPNQAYLLQELTGRMLQIAGDERAPLFLGDSEVGSRGILNRYLKLKDDKSNRAQTVKLDRRRFGAPFNALRNTKTIGW